MIYKILKKNALKYPEKKALIFENNYLTYKELLKKVDNFKINLNPYTHIGVFLENSIEFVILLLAASKYKLTLIPFSTKNIDFEKFDIEYIYDGELKKIKSYKKKESGYIIVSTSGSTSEPKPIVLTEEIKLKRIEIAKKTYNLNKNDKILISTPMHHSLAQRGVLLPLTIGATAVLMKNFTPKKYLETIQKEKITFNFAVSTQLELITPYIENYDLSSIKSIVSTSYSLKDEIKEKLSNHLSIYECYGTSEIGCVTNLDIKNKKYSSSVGKALEGVDIKIKNGEILVKSPWKFKEYYKMPKITKEAFEGEYFKTGDLGEIKNGYLFYKGRKKELIKTGGISVYPIDIEREILKVKGIKEVAVIGIEDSYFGEAIIAVVVGDADKKDILKQVKNLAPYQRPVFYDFVNELPKNALGKLQKFKLKEKYKNLNIGNKILGIKR
jgi:long-chain acyl-CoA synthetase